MAVQTPAWRGGQHSFASIAYYGPSPDTATKLVAAVFHSKVKDPLDMRTWTSETTDVRRDSVIAAELVEFLAGHGVVETVTSDRIMGCPHQAGIDYPLGRTCPHCPDWVGIDRLTHEPISAPEPLMSADEVLEALSMEWKAPPVTALQSADAHREALVAPLLEAVDEGIARGLMADEEVACLFSYAMYLFAKWREVRAYPAAVRWLSLPGEGPFDIGGDIVTQDGGRILASVFDGDLEPIKRLILDQRANEYGRGAAVTAMALLAAWGEVPHDLIVDHFEWLAREGLPRRADEAWNSLACESVDIEALRVFPVLRLAYADGLIDEMVMRPSELDAGEAAPRGRRLDDTRERRPPIYDVAHAISWWSVFSNRSSAQAQPYTRAPKIGRNEPCPCGSGRKFKKCCGAWKPGAPT